MSSLVPPSDRRRRSGSMSPSSRKRGVGWGFERDLEFFKDFEHKGGGGGGGGGKKKRGEEWEEAAGLVGGGGIFWGVWGRVFQKCFGVGVFRKFGEGHFWSFGEGVSPK